MERFSSSLNLIKESLYTFSKRITSHLVSLLFPHREKKESIGLGEELVVSHSDADPAHRNGECWD